MTNHADLIAALRIPVNVTLPGAPELDEYDEQRKAASDRIEELEAKLAKAFVHVADYSNDPHLVRWAKLSLAEINGGDVTCNS